MYYSDKSRAFVFTKLWQTSLTQKAIACIILLFFLLWVQLAAGRIHTILALTGMLAGFTLVQARFGFTSGWTAFITNKDGRNLRVQMLMMAIGSLLFIPILNNGILLGNPVAGWNTPISISLIAGGLIFGIGMQIAGCCASGTLRWAGSGGTRIYSVLAGFIAGSMFAASHIDFWRDMPGVSFNWVDSFGVAGGLFITLVLSGTAIPAFYINGQQTGFKLNSRSREQSNTLAYRMQF